MPIAVAITFVAGQLDASVIDPTLMQFGVGGIFALFVIREVLAFLSKKKINGNGNGGNGASGNKPVEFWRAEIEAAVDRSVADRVIPLLEEIKQTQKDDLEILRTRFHDVFEGQNRIQLTLEGIKSQTDRWRS